MPRMAGDQKMDNQIKTQVEIADSTGHTTLQLTKAETMKKVVENPGSWIFANDRLLQPAELADQNWATVGAVRLVPGLVGGL
ncbi:MAG: hypothetical protein HOB52_00495 [Euryarchaeota archaeon]|nr:hypothetical protein [Euryarchaeota archaeon]